MLSDKEIKQLVADENMLHPFIDHSVKGYKNGNKMMSYGLSATGYDVRLDERASIFCYEDDGYEIIDPKVILYRKKLPVWFDAYGEPYVIVPQGVSFASTLEWINTPSGISAMLLPKSSYARCGIDILHPLIDSGYKGNITVAIHNTNNKGVKLYLSEGFAQLVFFRTGEVENLYNGKYQGSIGTVAAR